MTLRTGLRDPGTGHHSPSLVRSDQIKTYLASHPGDKLDAKLAEKICLSAFPPNYMQLYPTTDSRESTDVPRTGLHNCEPAGMSSLHFHCVARVVALHGKGGDEDRSVNAD